MGGEGLLTAGIGLTGPRDQSRFAPAHLWLAQKPSFIGSRDVFWRLLYWHHRMFVRCIGPHHVRLGWVGIGSAWIAQRLARRPKQHDMRSRNNPMAVGVIARCIRAAVAYSASLP